MSALPSANRTTTTDKLRRARAAAPSMACSSTRQKNAMLQAMAALIAGNEEAILAANLLDLQSSGLRPSSRDRLLLNPQRIADMLEGIKAVIELPDPVGEILAEWVRPNGLLIRKVRVPLGVVGIIYESRPNVTVDAAVLALKSRQRRGSPRRTRSCAYKRKAGGTPEPRAGFAGRVHRAA